MKKLKRLEINVWILVGFIILLFGSLSFFGRTQKESGAVMAYAADLKYRPIATMPPKTSPTPAPLDPTKEELYKEFEAYVKTIFGKDAKVALAVSAVECNKGNKQWPGCVYSTEKEHSVGVFQINLAQENGKGPWIHASKVPGKTMEEKVEYLKNPFNNVLVAFKIFTDSKGFQPWSGFTSGNYKKHL